MSALQWVAMGLALALAPVVMAAAAVAFRIVGEDEARRRRRETATETPEGPRGDGSVWGCMTPDGPAIPAEDGPDLIERLADDGQHFIGVDYP